MTNLTKRIQMCVAGVLIVIGGVFLFLGNPAQALPIKNPENCQGPVTIGVATCPDKPGHWVECNNLGDYMCCVQNDQGGKDCEQIEDTTSTAPISGGKRFQGSVLQDPTIKPSMGTSRFPKAGARAPIIRRGLEGEQINEPSSEVPEQKDSSGETTK